MRSRWPGVTLISSTSLATRMASKRSPWMSMAFEAYASAKWPGLGSRMRAMKVSGAWMTTLAGRLALPEPHLGAVPQPEGERVPQSP